METRPGTTGGIWLRRITGVLLVGLIACAGPAPSADAPTSTVATSAPATTVTSEAVTTSAAITSTTLSPDAAPPELEGLWKVDEGQGVINRLTLRGNTYGWSFGPGGRISVNGDVIEFSNATDQISCPGSGSYRWQIEGDILTFSHLEPGDDCSVRRAHFADGKEYYR